MADSFSPEDVMKLLAVSERELARMVVDRELRAFRDGNETKFRRDDVLRHAKTRSFAFFGFTL